ncbi:transcriptional regulator, partial [Streptomyces sp. NPDC005009]
IFFFFVVLKLNHKRIQYIFTWGVSLLWAPPDEVGILTQKYAMLRTQALNTEDTRAMLDRLLGE